MSNTAHNQVGVERWGKLNVFTLLKSKLSDIFQMHALYKKYLVIFSTKNHLEARVTLSVAVGDNLSSRPNSSRAGINFANTYLTSIVN